MKTVILFTLLLLSVSASTKPTINYYVESLCPYSAKAMIKVNDALLKGFNDVANVNIINSGNAKLTGGDSDKNWVFQCQHGPLECWGNLMETCMNHLIKDKLTALESITCMYKNTQADGSKITSALGICSAQGEFESGEIQSCAASQEAIGWQHDAFLATPAHPGVPWVAVDGMTLTDDDQSQLTSDPMAWACKHTTDLLRATYCSAAQNVMLTDSNKLELTYYVESLCPDTVKTMGLLNSAIDNGLMDLAEIKLVTAGNAKVYRDSFRYAGQHDFTCQHGDDECYGNQLESCMLRYNTNPLGAMKAVLCMYARTVTHGILLPEAFNYCADQGVSRGAFSLYDTDGDVIDMKVCALDGRGNKLHYDNIQATPKDHTNIPWAGVDGVKLTAADQTALISDPLAWACAHSTDSDAKAKVCKKTISEKISSLKRRVLE